jgi:NDP-sugar pyrophosphorylase family protein
MNGDILTLMDFSKLYQFSMENKSDLVVTIKKYVTPFRFGNILFEGDFVTGIEEKVDIVKQIVAGIYIVKPGVFNIIPEDQYYGMDTLINAMLAKKLPVAKYQMTEYWLDIGMEEDYKKAQETYEEYFSNISSNQKKNDAQ